MSEKITYRNKAVGHGLVLDLPFPIQGDVVEWIKEDKSGDSIEYSLVRFRRAKGQLFAGWPEIKGPQGRLP